ncbi:MAG: S4 domain-containing protein [Vulcanimicrobiaceae bacterium]
MRLDRFLTLARLAKDRHHAHDALAEGRVRRDGRALKASASVRPDDLLQIDYLRRRIVVRIVALPAARGPVARGERLYELVAEEAIDPLDALR